MRVAGIATLAVCGIACGGAEGASDRPRIAAADSAFQADSATLAAIVERDAAERRRIAGTQTSGGFAPYTGGGAAAPAAFSSTGSPPPATPALDAAGVRAVKTYEAAQYLQRKKGRVTLAILYSTRCPRSRGMFTGFVALARRYEKEPFAVAAFSIDDADDKDRIPDFLARYDAPFDPLYIKPWQPGELIGALGPLGFRLPTPWNLPYVALLDSQGNMVAQWDGATNLAAIFAATQSQLAQ
ncbi:MAG: hypothetical protein DMD60_12765 [Gemmatimonadetes bacterium]|nr:MAG: hypothetical protein DMD60_12765 [Gemmatimonadota bacterium]